MTLQKTILLAATLVAAALVWSSRPAYTAIHGPYAIVPDAQSGNAWRIDTATGTVSFCVTGGFTPGCKKVGQDFPVLRE